MDRREYRLNMSIGQNNKKTDLLQGKFVYDNIFLKNSQKVEFITF
jgi:hypothetical protein